MMIKEGAIHGPAMEGERLVSRELTNAEMAVRSNYAVGETVILNRPYETLGVEKGDERTVSRVDDDAFAVRLTEHACRAQGRGRGLSERGNGASRRRPRALGSDGRDDGQGRTSRMVSKASQSVAEVKVPDIDH